MTTDHINISDPFSHEEMAAITGWINHADGPVARRNREQIIDTFPLLLPSLALQRSDPEHIALTAAIDGGFPLVDAIASLIGVKKKTVRFLRGKKPAQIGKAWDEDPFQLFKVIDEIPDHHRPRTTEDWRLLPVLWQYSMEASRTSRHKTNSHQEELGWHLFIGLCTAGYKQSDEILCEYSRLTDCRGAFSDFVIHVMRWCENWARRLGFNNAVAQIAKDKVAIDLLTRYPAIKLIEMSKQWHLTVVRSRDHTAEIAHWPPLLPEPVVWNELSVISLTDFFQLCEEGKQLNHCVSAYTRACLRGQSHILSIRDGSGRSLSTAEVTLIEDKCGDLIPLIIQHRGANNFEPDLSSTTALSAGLQSLSEYRSQTWFRKIMAALAARKSEIDEYRVRDLRESDLRAIDEVLPRPEQFESWLSNRLSQETLWHYHRIDLMEEAAARAGLEDLFNKDSYELWLDDPYRWAQYERLTGREQDF